jgi:hypothetical protein
VYDIYTYTIHIYFLAVLGFELRALCLLGRYYTHTVYFEQVHPLFYLPPFLNIIWWVSLLYLHVNINMTYIYINKIHIIYFDLHPPFSLLLILPHTVPLSHSCPIIMIVITLGLDSAYERKHAIFDF